MSEQNGYLGGLEEAVLLAIQSLGQNAYGATIHELLDDANRHISIGSLYVTLGRLEDKGFVKSRFGEATPERGGRAKRYFSLTGAAVTALQEADQTRQKLHMKQRFAGSLA